jgi:hypothetical protein
MTNLEPLWLIEETLAALINSADVCEPELRPELEMKIAEYISASMAKVDAVASVLASFDDVVENAKREIERLRARQQAAEKAAARLEQYVLRVIRQREGKPLRGCNTTLSMRHSESLVIDDPDAVPPEWKQTTVQVNIPKDPVKRAIRDGQEIPGVHVEQHEHLVRR